MFAAMAKHMEKTRQSCYLCLGTGDRPPKKELETEECQQLVQMGGRLHH